MSLTVVMSGSPTLTSSSVRSELRPNIDAAAMGGKSKEGEEVAAGCGGGV